MSDTQCEIIKKKTYRIFSKTAYCVHCGKIVFNICAVQYRRSDCANIQYVCTRKECLEWASGFA